MAYAFDMFLWVAFCFQMIGFAELRCDEDFGFRIQASSFGFLGERITLQNDVYAQHTRKKP